MERIPRAVWSDPELYRKYQYEQHLASSAMAVVVTARHLELDERVAIKFLSPEALRSGVAVARFRREAKAAARIKNQHVVRIIDVSTTIGGIPYIVMEYLDGKDLERLLAQCPRRQAAIHDVIDYILQASEAIVEGHSLGIVHRDLKPANLLCVDRGDGYPLIKVLDFGISKFVATTGDMERTDRYEILGSPRYMSPEQIDSSCSVDHRTDIWSLGVIVYQAIAGQVPFSAELVPDLWRQIRRESPTPLPFLRPDCPLELWKVVAKCLQKDPKRRHADLGELALALAPMAPERSRGSIDRIRWMVQSANQGTTRPSAFSASHDRMATNGAHGRYRWLVAGGSALTLGFGLTLAANHRSRELQAAPSSSFLYPLRKGDRSASTTPKVVAATMSASPLDVSPVALSPMVVPMLGRAGATIAGRPGVSSTSKRAFSPSIATTAASGGSAVTASANDEVSSMSAPSWMIDPVTRRK